MSHEKLHLRHQILILDANLEYLLSEEAREVGGFIQDLLKGLKMQELDKLSFHQATDERAPGWTFLQPITTSHISGHYFEKPGKNPHIHIDVYSCDGIDVEKILQISHKHFNLDEWMGTFIEREIDPMQRRAIEYVGKGSKILNQYSLHAQNLHTVIQEAKVKNVASVSSKRT